MAINTTGNNGSVVGVTGVHPDNMGNTLVFKDKVYNVNVGDTLTVGEDGLVDVKLSNASGNLLQKRGDGLYYGSEPPENLKNLYVDAINGVDQHPDDVVGAGTKSKPLRTIRYAEEISLVGTSRNIFIREGQDHILRPEDTFIFKDGLCRITLYGPTVEALRTANPDTGVAERMTYERGLLPRVVFKGYRVGEYPRANRSNIFHHCATVADNCALTFFGVALVNDISERYDVTSQYTYSSAPSMFRMQVSGSVILNTCSLHCEGTPTVNESIRNLAALKMPVSGIHDTGFFFGYKIKLTIATILNEDEIPNLRCNIITSHGWYLRMGNAGVFDLTVSDRYYRDFTKRVKGVIFDELGAGVKQVIVPSTNIQTTYWVE